MDLASAPMPSVVGSGAGDGLWVDAVVTLAEPGVHWESGHHVEWKVRQILATAPGGAVRWRA